jgi:hypothetical protein
MPTITVLRRKSEDLLKRTQITANVHSPDVIADTFSFLFLITQTGDKISLFSQYYSLLVYAMSRYHSDYLCRLHMYYGEINAAEWRH